MGGRDGLIFPGLFLLCRAVVELRYCSRSDSQSLSPPTTMRLSRKGIHPAGVPSFLFQVTVVTWSRRLKSVYSLGSMRPLSAAA